MFNAVYLAVPLWTRDTRLLGTSAYLLPRSLRNAYLYDCIRLLLPFPTPCMLFCWPSTPATSPKTFILPRGYAHATRTVARCPSPTPRPATRRSGGRLAIQTLRTLPAAGHYLTTRTALQFQPPHALGVKARSCLQGHSFFYRSG